MRRPVAALVMSEIDVRLKIMRKVLRKLWSVKTRSCSLLSLFKERSRVLLRCDVAAPCLADVLAFSESCM